MSGNGVSRYIAQEKLSETVTCVCYDSDPEEIKNLRNGDLYAMIIPIPLASATRALTWLTK